MCIEVDEGLIEVSDGVLGVCEILGLEPYDLANEGVCVISLPSDMATRALEILKKHDLGKNARVIGHVRADFNAKDSKTALDKMYMQKVVLKTKYGSKRFLEYPQGELLPRIC